MDSAKATLFPGSSSYHWAEPKERNARIGYLGATEIATFLEKGPLEKKRRPLYLNPHNNEILKEEYMLLVNRRTLKIA